MDWYWDSKAEQQVCYTKKGLEYMRYDPQTKEYSFRDFRKMSFGGEHGLFGDLTARATIEIGRPRQSMPVEERMQRVSLEDVPGPEHHRLSLSVSGS